jgi:hypothetical protein
MMMHDRRQSAEFARAVIEGLIPEDEDRARWLGLLADAIVAAHAVHPASWAVTLFDHGLRLNVFMIETVVFGPRDAMVVLDSSHVSDEEIDEIRLTEGRQAIDAYTTVPGTVQRRLAYEIADETVTSLRPALLSLVERAASRVRTRTRWAATHSPGVVEYAAQATGRQLPEPAFAWATGSSIER